MVIRVAPRLRSSLKYALLLPLSLVLGTAWHEIVGHGLAGVLCGGRLTYVKLLGFRVWPQLYWDRWEGYGACGIEGITGYTGEKLMELAGSGSTWLVSVAAIVLLWTRRGHGWPRVILVLLGLWWIDLFTYTLPTWGLRRSVLWGGTYSEPYEAAVALGIPGWLFQTFVIVSSVALATALIVRLRRDRRTRLETHRAETGTLR